MFEFDLEDKLRKKLFKLEKRDKVLVKIFKKKLREVITKDKNSITTYKNLKAPLNKFKRIHLTDNFILLFSVNFEKNRIIFLDILPWSKAYKH